eukprot:252891-Lingulodinium_polyedra.AAC.1
MNANVGADGYAELNPDSAPVDASVSPSIALGAVGGRGASAGSGSEALTAKQAVLGAEWNL